MGNVHMEATQINYRGGSKKMSVEEAIKAAGTEITPEEKTWIDSIPTLASSKADNDVIAPEFDSEAGVYAIGDLVMYEGKLYEFTTAHETAGDWDSTEVTEKTVADEIGSVKSGLNNSWSLGGGNMIANNTDLDNITTVGNYYATSPAAATLLHCPTTGAFKLKVIYDVRETAPTYIEQVFNPMSSYDEYRRYKAGNAEWSDWHLTNCNLDEIKSGLTNLDNEVNELAEEVVELQTGLTKLHYHKVAESAATGTRADKLASLYTKYNTLLSDVRKSAILVRNNADIFHAVNNGGTFSNVYVDNSTVLLMCATLNPGSYIYNNNGTTTDGSSDENAEVFSLWIIE